MILILNHINNNNIFVNFILFYFSLGTFIEMKIKDRKGKVLQARFKLAFPV